ncbi:MAG: PUA domain-containing protein [Halolamina sp.]
MAKTSRADLRTTADYQFGRGAGDALFPAEAPLDIDYSTGGRPSQIHAPDGRLASMGTDGRFTLGFAGGRRLHDHLDAPAYRVYVGDESEPFVREGENTFAKFVDRCGAAIRPGDEVLVVHEDGELLGVGRAELAAEGMLDFQSGMAVMVREGVDEYVDAAE